MLNLVLCSNSRVVVFEVQPIHPIALSWIPPLDHSSSFHILHSWRTLSSWMQHYCSDHSLLYTLQDLHESTSRVLSRSQNSCNTWKDLRRCQSHWFHEMPKSSYYSTIDTSKTKCSLNGWALATDHPTTSSPPSTCTHSSNTHDSLLPTLIEQLHQIKEQHLPLDKKQTHQHPIPWRERRSLNRNHHNKGKHVCRECNCSGMADRHCKEPSSTTASLTCPTHLQEQLEQSQTSTGQWKEGRYSWWWARCLPTHHRKKQNQQLDPSSLWIEHCTPLVSCSCSCFDIDLDCTHETPLHSLSLVGSSVQRMWIILSSAIQPSPWVVKCFEGFWRVDNGVENHYWRRVESKAMMSHFSFMWFSLQITYSVGV